MKLEQENITFIKSAFGKMKSKQDLLALLNYGKVIVYGKKVIPFEIKSINYHSYPKANRQRYNQFYIKNLVP